MKKGYSIGEDVTILVKIRGHVVNNKDGQYTIKTDRGTFEDVPLNRVFRYREKADLPTGVDYHQGRYRARSRCYQYLGMYDTPEAAHAAYLNAMEEGNGRNNKQQ